MSFAGYRLPIGPSKPISKRWENSDNDDFVDPSIRTRKRASGSSSDSASTHSLNRNIIDLTQDESDEQNITKKKRRLRLRSTLKHTENREYESESDGDHGSVEFSENEEPEVPIAPGSSLIVATPPTPPPPSQGERLEVEENLKCLSGPPVSVVNDRDESSPTQFTFIEDHVLGEGVEKLSEDFMIGCECRDENGRNCGCEYRNCGCLQESARDENDNVHFPYSAGRRNYGALRQIWLGTRWHIFECNRNCNCKDNCKNKVVQNGRQIPFEIFKTINRGWGLRSPKNVIKGQYIDTYRGEIITNEEAENRGEQRGQDPNNYMMDLDKFCEKYSSPADLKELISAKEYRDIKRQVKDGEYDTKTGPDGKALWLNPNRNDHYVCDSREMGGPTKFMNHSCMPNCRIFTVSYNHADRKVYDIAFFAICDIPAYTELTFDYKDENDRSVITDARALELKEELGFMPIPCLCGSRTCRKYFFN